MSYIEIMYADQRLTILQLLEKDQDYSLNEGVLQSLLAGFGHAISSDLIRNHLRWLEEQGLVEVTDVLGAVVAKLRPRGQDVSLGRGQVDGIARPRPA